MSKKVENKCYERNVQKCFEGAASVAETYPGPTYQVGEKLITSWKTLIDKLGILSKSNSTTLSLGSTQLLKAISLLKNFGKSPTNLLDEWAKAMPKYLEARKNIVSDLSGSIGVLSQHINEAMTNVASDTIEIVNQFNNHLEGNSDQCKNIDYKPLIKSTQILTNVIALIAETFLDLCGLKTDVYEAIYIVTLVLNSNVIGGMGTYTNIAAVLYSESVLAGISEILNNCLKSLTQLVQGMANSINSMTSTADIADLLKDFVELTIKFNDQLYSFGLGFCNEDRNKSVKLTVNEIKQQLSHVG